ncbi:hypothetical protein [Streptomyces sp. NPDC048057]|uniref:DUF7848 domain-containing protein n=1 Tax=Streptomyces sp. NPDC048057 TaxID=3155628 RepID=UPI0033F89055
MPESRPYGNWAPHPVPSEGITVSVACALKAPECGEKSPAPGMEEADHERAEDWMAYHLEQTGHALYKRVVHDTVQWRPDGRTAQ